MIAFCFDSLGDYGLGYPNLAQPNLDPDQFDHTYPRTLPLRLLMYLKQRSINFSVHTVTNAPLGAWYPVAWGWHDFECDYFGLMSDLVKKDCEIKKYEYCFTITKVTILAAYSNGWIICVNCTIFRWPATFLSAPIVPAKICLGADISTTMNIFSLT